MTSRSVDFDEALGSADERRHFVDLLTLPSDARVLEHVVGATEAADESFDGVCCIDGIARVSDRAAALSAWARCVKPRGRILYTDPAIVAGLVTSEEIATRSSMGRVVFSPQGENEFLIESAGLRLLRADDATDTLAITARRFHEERARNEGATVAVEGRERYETRQRFLHVTHKLASERRLARIAFLLERPS